MLHPAAALQAPSTGAGSAIWLPAGAVPGQPARHVLIGAPTTTVTVGGVTQTALRLDKALAAPAASRRWQCILCAAVSTGDAAACAHAAEHDALLQEAGLATAAPPLPAAAAPAASAVPLAAPKRRLSEVAAGGLLPKGASTPGPARKSKSIAIIAPIISGGTPTPAVANMAQLRAAVAKAQARLVACRGCVVTAQNKAGAFGFRVQPAASSRQARVEVVTPEAVLHRGGKGEFWTVGAVVAHYEKKAKHAPELRQWLSLNRGLAWAWKRVGSSTDELESSLRDTIARRLQASADVEECKRSVETAEAELAVAREALAAAQDPI